MVHAVLGAAVLVSNPCAYGQELAQKVSARFTPGKVDPSGNVNGGSILVLQKDGLLMYPTSMPSPPQSNYANGRISRNPLGKGFFGDLGNAMLVPGQSAQIPQRNAGAGEKFWLTKADVKDDGVILGLLSDVYDGVRWRAELKFPFPKKSPPPADLLLSRIGEAVTVQTVEPPAAPPQPQPGPDAPLAPIAPPPPPPADAAPPAAITVGQTVDQVLALLGQPKSIVDLGAKKIYVYPDIKVTFVDGKMTTAE
jgi:hypothetical protein